MSNSLTLAPAPRSEAAEQVRAEGREFLAAELAAGTFETHVDTWLSGVDPSFSRKLGERGWLGMTWPRRYGGHERAALDGHGVTHELPLRRARAVGDGALRRHRGAARGGRAGRCALDRRPAVGQRHPAVRHRGAEG